MSFGTSKVGPYLHGNRTLASAPGRRPTTPALTTLADASNRRFYAANARTARARKPARCVLTTTKDPLPANGHVAIAPQPRGQPRTLT